MATKRNVSKREYNQWVKWLKHQGYSGPFGGLKPSHECVKRLAKELRKDPPTILETQPRDARTIASNLTRYERRKGRPEPNEIGFVTLAQYERDVNQILPQLRQLAKTGNNVHPAHTGNVLTLLDTYITQLLVPYEPEDFIISPEGGAPLNEKESAYRFFAKKAVPSSETLIDNQIDSESLGIAPELERETLFVALKGHYNSTQLWKDIKIYKKVAGEYVSIGLKIDRTMEKLIGRCFTEETEAHTFRSALTELIREDLAPVRAKLLLQGIETDKSAVLRRLPDKDCTSLREGVELLQRYLNGKSTVKAQNDSELFVHLLDLLNRIRESYQLLKTKEGDILRGIKEEKFKGQLPAGSRCKLCPAV